MAGNAYSVAHQTAAGTDLGIIAIGSDGTVMVKMYDLIIGSDATPADLAGEFVVNRCTDTGTGGTAVTPEPTSIQTAAASATATGGTYTTAQPTDTANCDLLMIGLNQRATFRWVAAPGMRCGIPRAGSTSRGRWDTDVGRRSASLREDTHRLGQEAYRGYPPCCCLAAGVVSEPGRSACLDRAARAR